MYYRRRGERPLAFWWHRPRKKIWSMGCCGLESGDAVERSFAPAYARDAKHVPGRKTDVSDAAWLQRLHEFGLLRGSFRPQGAIAALRTYLRQRERLLDYT